MKLRLAALAGAVYSCVLAQDIPDSMEPVPGRGREGLSSPGRMAGGGGMLVRMA